jgi:hypothetical protein
MTSVSENSLVESECFLYKIRSVSSYHHMNATKQHHLTVIRLRDDSQISKPIENTVPDQKYTAGYR